MSFGSDAGKTVPYVVAATESVMEAASEVASVKRIVLTSSSVAAVIPEAGHGHLELTQGQSSIFLPNAASPARKVATRTVSWSNSAFRHME
jgi:nucleoside-diphosphate-sugar epimerase